MKLRHLIWATAVATALSVAGCSALDAKQRAMIFQPSDRVWQRADMAGMQDVWIDFHSQADQQAVRLHGLWLPQASPQAPVLLYLHGARWNVTGSTQRMRHMHALGFAVLAIDYRGFGQTQPASLPSEVSAPCTALSRLSISRSTTTAYRPSLPPKCSYTTGLDTLARWAISSMEVPS